MLGVAFVLIVMLSAFVMTVLKLNVVIPRKMLLLLTTSLYCGKSVKLHLKVFHTWLNNLACFENTRLKLILAVTNTTLVWYS
jgi:hypothetical protein